jgi:hypothetical protein
MLPQRDVQKIACWQEWSSHALWLRQVRLGKQVHALADQPIAPETASA